MDNRPVTVNIELQDLVTLLNYYWSSVNSEVGDLGDETYEKTVDDINRRSSIKITASELESLVYHMKQAIFEKLKPMVLDLRIKNYEKMMKRLSHEIPQLFETLPSGEIVFIDFEDRENVERQ